MTVTRVYRIQCDYDRGRPARGRKHPGFRCQLSRIENASRDEAGRARNPRCPTDMRPSCARDRSVFESLVRAVNAAWRAKPASAGAWTIDRPGGTSSFPTNRSLALVGPVPASHAGRSPFALDGLAAIGSYHNHPRQFHTERTCVPRGLREQNNGSYSKSDSILSCRQLRKRRINMPGSSPGQSGPE